MNERIKELAEQAQKVVGYTDGGYTEIKALDQEKFALLIIDECLRMCDCADVSLLEHSYPREADGAASVKIFIKEHFGVEE
jgi:hypothetical protein